MLTLEIIIIIIIIIITIIIIILTAWNRKFRDGISRFVNRFVKEKRLVLDLFFIVGKEQKLC